MTREQNAFVESYGSKLLDASMLLLPSVGFLPAADPRVRGTLAAIERHLMRDGFVLRHDPREVSTKQQPIEGAFLACTLWLADAYVLAGEHRQGAGAVRPRGRGRQRSRTAAEEFDTAARRQTGNFPQALTHIALINTAHNLSACQARRREAGDAAVEVIVIRAYSCRPVDSRRPITTGPSCSKL